MRAEVIEEVRQIGIQGFQAGYSAAADQLIEPIAATWLASESGLPVGRCRVILAEFREVLVQTRPVAG